MTVFPDSVMLSTRRPPLSIRTIVLSCSGSSTTAAYCGPRRADRMFPSILPENSAAPVVPLISVSESPTHAATPESLDCICAPPPIMYDHFVFPLASSFAIVPPS